MALSGYEEHSLEAVEQVLNGLTAESTSADVYEETLPFDARSVAAVAARRAGFNGGTITNPLTISPTTVPDEGYASIVTADDAARSSGGYTVTVQDEFGDLLFAVTAFGGIYTRGDIWGDNASFRVGASRAFQAINAAGAAMFEAIDPGQIGFYGHAPVAQQTGVAVNAAAIHAALVNLGLITA